MSCAIELYSAQPGLHFHLIKPKTGHRLRMLSQDAETDEEISQPDLVKLFEFEKGRYVLLDDGAARTFSRCLEGTGIRDNSMPIVVVRKASSLE